MNKRTREIVNSLSSLAAEAETLRKPDGAPSPSRVSGLRVSASSGDTTEMFMYGDIGANWWGDGVSATDVATQLRAITTPQIRVFLNSNGGDVFEGVAIHSLFQRHPATVSIEVDGVAASAASFIAQAGNSVKIARNAMMMIHDASTYAAGNAADMRQVADLLDKVSGNIADMYAERAGDSAEEWRERMLAETWYTGQEAVDIGLADELTETDEKATAKRVSTALARGGFKNAPPAPLVEPPSSATPPEERGESPETVDVIGRELAFAMLADSLK